MDIQLYTVNQIQIRLGLGSPNFILGGDLNLNRRPSLQVLATLSLGLLFQNEIEDHFLSTPNTEQRFF